MACLFLGDVLHVGDVGSGLREDVVQIIADANEGESLLQEFAADSELIFWWTCDLGTREGLMLV